ncbi:GNAT family N-acetyltransferase [Quadrisphaera sp. INWT6]|nr:GNAT family N-acetyltransferase [Quadrisphaera sp. INWT6]MBF5080713.1 GNAT family N-acetyltransferase [Quadrisphaera sp. INWT6]
MFRSPLRVLDDADRADVLALCAQDPVASIFVTSRVAAVGADPARLGGQLWGWCPSGRLEALCWDGANLVPVLPGGAGPAAEAALDAFATRARRSGRRCSSLVGSADAVMGLWSRLESSWGPARDVRPDQPLMAVRTPPLVAPDTAVRRATPADLDVLVPACIAMFTEEVGYSPTAGDGGATYRRRVEELVSAGRSFVRIEGSGDDRQVVFKAELGAVAPGVAQVQGVWVHPDHRGRGLAEPGMSAVVLATQAAGYPVVSLYVNDFNTRAVRAYEAVGFERVGTFATVLF